MHGKALGLTPAQWDLAQQGAAEIFVGKMAKLYREGQLKDYRYTGPQPKLPFTEEQKEWIETTCSSRR